jgi:hypothetical protein
MDWLKKLLTTTLIKSYIRKLLAVLSGWLLATVPDVGAETVAQFVESLTQIITAALPVILSIIWSLIDKKKK